MDATIDKNIDRMLADALGAGRAELSEIESKQILDALRIPVAIAHRAGGVRFISKVASRSINFCLQAGSRR